MGMQAGAGATQHPGMPTSPVPFGMQMLDPQWQQQQMHQWMVSAQAEQRAQQSIADAKERAMQQHLQQLQHQIATLSAGSMQTERRRRMRDRRSGASRSSGKPARKSSHDAGYESPSSSD